MSKSEFRKTLRNYLRSSVSKEEAFEAYVSLIEKTINRPTEANPTHAITWSKSNEFKEYLVRGLIGHWSKLLKKPLITKKNSFSFKTYHSFNDDQLDKLELAKEHCLQTEDYLKVLIGIFAWLFLLSLPASLFVGWLSIYLAIFGIGVVLWSLYRLSTAKFRYLPEDLRQISADYWSIESLSETKIKKT